MIDFLKTQSGDITYSIFIRLKNVRVDEYEILKKASACKIAGLEKQLTCTIKVHEEAFKMRAQACLCFKFKDWILLPTCITKRMCKDTLLSCMDKHI